MAKTQNTKVIDAILSSTGSKTPSTPRRGRRVKGFGQKAAGSAGKKFAAGAGDDGGRCRGPRNGRRQREGTGRPSAAPPQKSTGSGAPRRTRRTTAPKAGRELPRETLTPEAEHDLVQSPRRGRRRAASGSGKRGRRRRRCGLSRWAASTRSART